MTGRRPHGDGSIFAYRNGFAAVLDLGWVDGKRRRRWVYGRTEAETLAKLDDAKEQARRGVNLAAKPRTFAEWLDEWLALKERAGTRPSTLRGYRWLAETHLRPSLGRTKLAKVTPTQIRRLLEAKADCGLSTATVRHIHAMIRNVLGDAEREELVARNAAKLVRPPALSRPERRALTVEEAQALLLSIRGDRLEALWACALALGLRRGELLGLRWADVDPAAKTVSVRQALLRVDGRLVLDRPKTMRSARTIPAPDVIMRHLREHRTRQVAERLRAGQRWQESGLVFTSVIGTPLEPRNVDRVWHEARSRVGLGWLRLHDLRHACATFLLLTGASPRTVMETLGHSQIALTMNTYAHVLPQVEREAVDQAARTVFGEP